MEIAVVKELIQAFSEAGLTHLSITCEDFELELGKEQAQMVPLSTMMPQQVNPTMAPMPQAILQTTEKGSSEQGKTSSKVIVAPMVGTFYAASSPNAKPLVKVGSVVKKGDVVCIIEAMKLMNEVEAEEDGEIVEILVKNEEMVEYNQPLFVLK